MDAKIRSQMKVVWLLKFELTARPERRLYDNNTWGDSVYASAFALTNDGLLVTTVQPYVEGCIITARRQYEDGFKYPATVIHAAYGYGILLLKLEIKCIPAKLSPDGSVKPRETLHHLGSPGRFVWSYMTGHAVFPCQDIGFPTTVTPCHEYHCDVMRSNPTHRLMGYLWNSASKLKKSSFEGQLYAETPVIQTAGLISGPGAYGGPLFNEKWEIVGLVVCSYMGYEIAIHVSVIQEYYNLYKTGKLQEMKVKRKELPEMKVEGKELPEGPGC